ncbi:MAG: hypothetical protein AAGA43_03835 [Bacteroidota bacterium]
MPKTNLLKTLNQFQKEKQDTALQITFNSLEITSYRNGEFLDKKIRYQSQITVQKTPDGPMAKIVVLDDYIFRFSFQVRIPKIGMFQRKKVIYLPRPLDEGYLRILPHQMELSFRIRTLDPRVDLQIGQIYKGPFSVEKIPASVIVKKYKPSL